MAKELSKTLSRTILPVILSLGVAAWLIHRDIDLHTLREISFDFRTIAGLLLALLFVCGRDFGLAWRFHTIADGALTWKRSIRTDLMCAFTSAITPSVVGGSALAIFYLNQEGLKLGRATALTLVTLFLDELFFVIFCPIIVLVIPWDSLFEAGAMENELLFGSVKWVFWLVYTGIVIWTAILYFAILGRPQAMQNLLKTLASKKILHRWHKKIEGMADNMAGTSDWIRHRDFRWGTKVMAATILSWFSRYFVVNALFWTFVPGSSQLLVFARQFVVWVVLMVSPTPGGSGISEWLFANYYGDIIGNTGIAAVMALIWRLFSYFIYIIIGIALLPAYFGERANRKAQRDNTSL